METSETTAAALAPGSQYAIVEQMGHRRFGARVVPETWCGIQMLRCEILAPEGTGTIGEARVHPQSIYAVTTVTEAQARQANRSTWALRDVVPQLEAEVEGEDDGLEDFASCGADPAEDDIPL